MQIKLKKLSETIFAVVAREETEAIKMSGLDGKISVKQNEYRPCTVDGKRALFHRWYEFNNVIDAGLTLGSHPAGQLKFMFAIVEYEDGTIEEVAPPKVKFCDEMCTRKWFESEAEKE